MVKNWYILTYTIWFFRESH